MGPSIEWERFKPALFTMAVVGTLACGAVLVHRLAQEAADAVAEEAAEAASETPAPLTLESVKKNADDAALAGHNAWMLTSSALVLFMTAPGLAMFYGGLVRKKNVLSVIMQCLFLMSLMTTIWALYGYSLSFGGSNAYIGNGDFLFMKGVERTWDEADQRAG